MSDEDKKKSSKDSSDNDNNSNDEVIDLSEYETSSEKDKEELDKAKKDYLYLMAEFENYKKSAIKERSDLIKYGTERLIVELLEAIDTFDRALEIRLTPENLDSYAKGIELTRSELSKTLARFGVTEIDCQGEAFDPSLHEALSSEATTEIPPGHVLRVFKKAFKLHDRLIRPAQVVVAKEPDAKQSTDKSNENEG